MASSLLFNKRVAVLRPVHQAQSTADAIRERGGQPVVLPVIEICNPPDPEPVERAAQELRSYDWVLFTSANGVERSLAAFARVGVDARALSRVNLGVIGPQTAHTLERHGVQAQLVARQYVAEELARALLQRGSVRRVLLLRALSAREALPELLRDAGVHVDVVAVYETRSVSGDQARALADLIEGDQLDVVMFTSSSTVTSAAQLLGARAIELLARTTVASIGPVTTETAHELGIRVDVTAQQHTVDGLLDALEEHLEVQS